MQATTNVPPIDGSRPEEATHDSRAKRIANDLWRVIADGTHLVWETAKFLVFLLYALLGVVAFWLWAFTAVLLVLRFVLRMVMTPLLYTSEVRLRSGSGHRRTMHQALVEEWSERWNRRQELYGLVARPLAGFMYEARRTSLRFWDLAFPRKVLVTIVGFFLIFLPGMYFVPRVNYVQITDDNAINIRTTTNEFEYLVHGIDMFDPDHTREYENVNMWWLGKLNSQGMKNKIVPGRFYRVWVVGIRWYIPQLYPNLIDVTEVDSQGRTLEHPSQFIPSTTTGH